MPPTPPSVRPSRPLRPATTAAQKLLRLHTQLTAPGETAPLPSGHLVLVCAAPDGQVLAWRAEAGAAPRSVAALTALVQRHAAVLLDPTLPTTGLLEPTGTNDDPDTEATVPLAYISRPVALAGHAFRLIELTPRAASLPTGLPSLPDLPVTTQLGRTSQLALATELLTHAAQFQRPTELLAFVLHKLVARTPAVCGAVYTYDPATHTLRRLFAEGAPNDRLAATLNVRADAIGFQRLNRQALAWAGQVLRAEMTSHCPDRPLAVLPVCSDTALHYVLVVVFEAGSDADRADAAALLALVGQGLNSLVAREHLRRELVASEAKYESLFATSADGILLTDGLRVVDANAAAAALLGVPRAALLADSQAALARLAATVAESSGPSWGQLLNETRLTGRPHSFEGRLAPATAPAPPLPPNADASPVSRLVEMRLHRVRFDEQAYVQVLLRDLTERAATDQALLRAEVQRQSARQLRNLLGTVALAYVSLDREALITAVNDYFVDLAGYPRQELLGRNYFDLFVPDPAERERRQTNYQENIIGRQLIRSDYERELLTRTGERRIIRWYRLLEYDEQNTVTGIVSVGRDVTASIQAREASLRSEARLQDLFDNAHDLIQHVAPDNRFLHVNRAWRETLGYDDADIPQLTLHDIVHPYHRAKLMYQLRALYRSEDVSRLETVFLTKTGRSVHLIGSFSAQWEGGSVVAARIILHDITERIKAERLQKVYYSIANLAISTRDLDTLYAAIHRELGRLLSTHNFLIALCDEHRQHLSFVYYADQHLGPQSGGQERPFGRGVSEYVIEQGRPQFFLRTDLDALVGQGILALHGLIPQVLLAAPLAVGGRVIGCIAVQDYANADTYSATDLEVLHFISGQVALAIDRKRSEMQLNRQNARLNAIFESGSHQMWSVTPQGLLSAYNHNFARFFFDGHQGRPALGSAPDSMAAAPPGLHLPAIPKPQDAEMWRREYARAFAGQTRHFELQTNRPDGSEAWADVYLNPIRLPDGTLEEVSGIAHDITEQKLAQLGLERQEELFRGIFESFQDVYYRTDAAGLLTLLSPSVETIFGYRPEEIVGRPAIRFYFDTAEYDALVARVRETGFARSFEAAFVDRTGRRRAVLINARLRRDPAGTPIGMEGLVMDIGELKQTQQALLLAKQEAETALHAKTQFLANMSHELRTPMNGIIGMIDLLQQTVTTPEKRDYVETLRRSSEALLAILNDILDLSKIQAGKLTVHPGLCDLHEVLDKVMALFANRAAQKDLRFKLMLHPALPRFVETDEMRLLQILSNLVSNAIKFTSAGEVGLIVCVAPTDSPDYDPATDPFTLLDPAPVPDGELLIRFQVVDSGIGISAEDAARLFTDFTQLDTTSTKSFGGTGLGLSISRQLTELLGGRIGVRPNPTGGSIFWFTIRCQPADAAAGDRLRAQREQARRNRATGFFPAAPPVLLVDDNAVNQKVAALLLQRLGCQITVADNGYHALARVQETPAGFRLILMDIQMPDLDGIETTARLRAQLRAAGLPCPPVVAMTAYSMQGDEERFIAAGFDGYVAKPVKSHHLYEALRRYCPTEPVIEPHVVADLAPGALATPEAEGLAEEAEMEPEMEAETEIAVAVPEPSPEVVRQLVEIGGAEFTAELFAEYIREAAPQLEQAALDLKAGRVGAVLAPVHQFKGASAQLGLTELAELARSLEQRSRAGRPAAELTADFRRLRALFTAFSEHYARFLPAA